MTSIHNKGTLKSGDYLTIELSCGHKFELLIYANNVFIKTNDDDLDVQQYTSFGVNVKQVPRDYGK
jgi:hypothetical protein